MVNPIQSRENAVKAIEAWERGDYIPSQTQVSAMNAEPGFGDSDFYQV